MRSPLFIEKYIAPEARDAFRKDTLAALMVGLCNGATTPFILYIARDRLHSGVVLIGLINSSFFIGNLFAILWANTVTGKNTIKFTAYSWILSRFLNVLILFAFTPLSFAIIVSAVQFIATVSTPAYAAIMKAIYPNDQRGRIMGYCRVGAAITAVVSTFAVGFILQKWSESYRIIFPLAGVIGIVGALVFSLIKMPIQEKSLPNPPLMEFVRDSLEILRRDRSYRLFTISVFIYGFGNLLLLPIYPIFQVDVLHIKATQLAVLSNIAQAVLIISYLYWGIYIDRYTPLKGALVSIIVSLIAPLNYIFAHSVWALWPAFVVSGFANAGIEMTFFNCTLHFAEPERVAQYQGLHAFLVGIRGTIAPIIGAAMKGAGVDFRFIFLIGLILMLTGGVMQTACLKRIRGIDNAIDVRTSL
jgi:MFS family permease